MARFTVTCYATLRAMREIFDRPTDRIEHVDERGHGPRIFTITTERTQREVADAYWQRRSQGYCNVQSA